MSNKNAWVLAQLVAGIKPKTLSIDPATFVGQWAEAYQIYQAGNGKGPTMLQSWLAQPGHEAIRTAVFAHRPNTPPPPDEPASYQLTDMGNAERLAAQHNQRLRYVREWDWMVYDGQRWKRDPGGAVRCAKSTVRRIYGEAESAESDERRKSIAGWAIKSEARTRIDAMLSLAQSEQALAAEPKQFDADPYLINVNNGTVDLRTGKLHPHNPADLITRLAPVDYDPTAKCPTWDKFLATVFEADKEVITYTTMLLGYSLTGDTTEQILVFCYGLGRNGKSTMLELARYIMGDYGQQAEATTFLVKSGDTIRNDLARMAGVRYAAAIEVGEGRRLNETLIKQVTGQDTLTARFLHREHFEFVPQFKLWMAANHKPIIRGTDEAIWRRIRLIPFEVTIPQNAIDRKLKSKLQAEANGIFAQWVQGCLQWQRLGLKTPKRVIEATREYRADMDVISAFLDACCVIEANAKCTAGELYRAYVDWAEANNESVENQRSFGLRMTERNIERDRSNGVWVYHGIGLVDRERDKK